MKLLRKINVEIRYGQDTTFIIIMLLINGKFWVVLSYAIF